MAAYTAALPRRLTMHGMERRLLLAAVLAAWPARQLLAAGEDARPRHKISAATLFEALAKRFPVRAGFGPLLQLQVDAQQLLLQPARNRLGASLSGQLDGLQAGPATRGEVDLVFALRYEPSDRTLRAHQAEVLDVRWPGLAAQSLQPLRSLLREMAQHVGEVVLHKLEPGDLALAETMGFEPQELRVEDDGLMVFFGPKARS